MVSDSQPSLLVCRQSLLRLKETPTLPHPPLYKILAGTLPELNTLHWFSVYVYSFERADIPVTAQVVQQLRVRVTESKRLDGGAHSVLHNIEVSG